MQHIVYQTKVKDLDYLKHRLIDGIQQSFSIDNAINWWPKRLRGCVRATGGHFNADLTLASVRLCELNIAF